MNLYITLRYYSTSTLNPWISSFDRADQTYIISKKAEAILSTVLIDILEESLEDARNLAVTAGKHSVTHKEMERSLRNLCLRLSTVPAYNARIGPRNNDEDKDSVNSFKVCRKEKDKKKEKNKNFRSNIIETGLTLVDKRNRLFQKVHDVVAVPHHAVTGTVVTK